MGLRPDDKTLDRVDNLRGYCKENCRWATKKEQMNNFRGNIKITWGGEEKTLAQWVEDTRLSELNITYTALQRRHKKYIQGACTLEEMMTTSNFSYRSKPKK